MDNKNIVLIGLLILVLGALGFALYGFFDNSNKPQALQSKQVESKQVSTLNNQGNQGSSEFETKSSSSAISIDLTPTKYDNGKFYIDSQFNTHSGDLAQYNLMELVRLEFKGKSIAPSTVPSISGHHTGGTFVFDVEEKPDVFSIKIKDMPDIKDREFKWP